MLRVQALLSLTLVCLVSSNDAYRILCAFPWNGKSQFAMFGSVCQELAKRGHQIDMISHFPARTPIANYTDVVDLNGTRESVVNGFTLESAKILDKSVTYHMTKVYGNSMCDLLGHERMQRFLMNRSNRPSSYDLVITQFMGMPCYLGLSHYLKAPVAVIVATLEMAQLDQIMANPIGYAYFSGMHNPCPTVNTFFERLWNLAINYRETQLYFHYTSEQTEIMRKYLGPDVPDVRELERSISLALINSHYSLFGIRPITPAVVEVGGLHFHNDESKFTPELESWLNDAKQGVVYFSLGSLIVVETLPKDTMLSLYASFAKIAPIKVLMKSVNASKLPPGLPSNVVTSPWLPQIPVLRHKNTKLFITHGGLMGLEEAIYHGVPMIGIPVFIDQRKNVNTLVHKNVAVKIQLDSITEHAMDVALNAVLYDPKYRQSAKKLSRMFRDRPISPMDTAIYWIEYVIRNGPDSLRSPAADLPWWKRNLVDVIAFLVGCCLLFVYLSACLLKILTKIVRRSKPRAKTKIG